MQFFTLAEFQAKYDEYASTDVPNWKIEGVCEVIYSHIGLRYRDSSWDTDTVPSIIKNASMEQLRFFLEHDIPFVDIDKNAKAGAMSSQINTDLSTLAQRMLANGGYLYRGNPINQNMGINLPFNGGC